MDAANRKLLIIVSISIVILAIATIFTISFLRSKTPAPVKNAQALSDVSPAASPAAAQPTPSPQSATVRASEIAGAASEYKFSATIPSAWQAEAVAGAKAINLYDPAIEGANNLEKSQIFIRTFTAGSFLTLSTVTIHAREELSIGGRPAVRYDIEKKESAAKFADQPSWRNERHIVTDIRVSDNNPSVFYVIAKRPDLDSSIYEALLSSLDVNGEQVSLVLPVEGFVARVKLKPFGILISKENSPVTPERFSGYHTGADAEFTDTDADIPVKSIAKGTVVRSTTAAGYGGVLVIRHIIDSKPVIAVYGHLDPKSLAKNGREVKAGEQIGLLGDGESDETDGERKHLHFAVRQDDSVDLRGYVNSAAELAAWLDPILMFDK